MEKEIKLELTTKWSDLISFDYTKSIRITYNKAGFELKIRNAAAKSTIFPVVDDLSNEYFLKSERYHETKPLFIQLRATRAGSISVHLEFI